MTTLEIYSNKYKYAVIRRGKTFPLRLQISILTMAIFLSVQEGSLNEVRCEVKMCFTVTCGSNKCPLVGVIGLFNKTVTVLKSFTARRRLDKIEVIRRNPLKALSFILY